MSRWGRWREIAKAAKDRPCEGVRSRELVGCWVLLPTGDSPTGLRWLKTGRFWFVALGRHPGLAVLGRAFEAWLEWHSPNVAKFVFAAERFDPLQSWGAFLRAAMETRVRGPVDAPLVRSWGAFLGAAMETRLVVLALLGQARLGGPSLGPLWKLAALVLVRQRRSWVAFLQRLWKLDEPAIELVLDSLGGPSLGRL